MKCCFKKCLSPLKAALAPSLNFDHSAITAQAAALKDQAATLFAKADDLANFTVERTQGFNMLDFAVLKICLLSFGLWLGSKFADFLKRYRLFLFLGFLFSYVYLIWRIFLSDQGE